MAEPSGHKGGTQMRVPSGPLGQIMGFPEFVLAEPKFGCRLIRQPCYFRQSAFLTRETIFKIFEKS
jgi:hypothetical protein